MAKKKTTASAVDTVSDAYAADYEILERGIRDAYASDEEPSQALRLHARTKLGMERAEFNACVRRVRTVIKNEEIGGTIADRNRQKSHAEAAEAELADRGAELRAEIEELSKQLRALETAARLSKKRLAEMEVAVSNLQASTPPHRMAEYNSRKRDNNSTIRAELLATQTEIAAIEAHARFDPNDQTHLSLMRSLSPSFVVLSNKRRPVVTPEWLRFLDEEQARLPGLKESEAELQTQYDSAMAEIEHLKDYYIR